MRKGNKNSLWKTISSISVVLLFLMSALAPAVTASIAPITLEATLKPGESVSETKTVEIPALPPRADVIFAFDLTGSMIGITATAKARAIDIMNNLDATGVDINYGVASYMDYPHSYTSFGYGPISYGSSGCGDYAYNLGQSITIDKTAVSTAINALVNGCGDDGPQDYTRIMYESYSDSAIGWRAGAKKIIVNFGDNIPHDNNLNEGVPGKSGIYSTGGDPGRNGVMDETSDPSKIGSPYNDDLNLQTVLNEMAANNVILLEAHTTSYANDYWAYWTGITGGNVFITTSGGLVTDMVTKITAALTSPTISNLHLQPSAGYESWLTSSTPPSYSGPTGVTKTFEIVLTVPVGTAPGDYTFTISAIDEAKVSYGDQSVTIHVKEPNLPPTANAGPDQTVEQDSLGGASVTLDGSGSTDDGSIQPLTYSWAWAGGSATGVKPAVTLPLGTTTVTLTVDDGQFTATDTVDIKVVDTTKPIIVVKAEPKVLWPPNHKYETVAISDFVLSVTDICDAGVDVADIAITSVSSDEPEDVIGNGDGNTMDDIVIAKSLKTVDLRSEREGAGNGRVYTINFKVTDASGNTATGSYKVGVPHDQSGHSAVDDGAAAGYIVTYP